MPARLCGTVTKLKTNCSWSWKGAFEWSSAIAVCGSKNGEFLIVPRGVEHRPVAEEEVQVLLFEPASTLNTGNAQSELTAAVLDRI